MAPPQCMLGHCKNKGFMPGVSYFLITPNRRTSWLKALNRNPEDILSRWNKVCSDHFLADDKISTKFGKTTLKEGAIPQLNIQRPLSVRSQKIIAKDVIVKTAEVKMQMSAKEENEEDINLANQDSSTSKSIRCYEPIPTSSFKGLSKKRKLETTVDSFSSTSRYSEDMKNTPKKVRKIIRTFHNYSLSPRRLHDSLKKNKQDKENLQMKYASSRRMIKKLRCKVSLLIHIMKDLETLLNMEKSLDEIPLSIMKRCLADIMNQNRGKAQYPDESRRFGIVFSVHKKWLE